MMAYPYINKKKIRGWKRKVKRIEEWKQRFRELDMEELSRTHRDYVKLWIDPFYGLTRRNPPLWYSRLLLQAMVDMYQSWFEQMKALKEPFYLKIWLYDPHFIQSQIVVAYRECLNFYELTFDKSSDHRAFPLQRYGRIPGLSPFHWELAIETEHYWLSELHEDQRLGIKTDKEIEAITRKAYKVEAVKASADEDTVYSVRTGDVWLGEC